MIIAIDGPAGAGKSTIARELARELNLQLIDTGAIYRAVAWRAVRQAIPLDAAGLLAHLAEGMDLRFEREDGENVLYCDSHAVGQEIRSPEVSRAASIVSAHLEVREALLELQRAMGRARSSVLEGRDIGTVVFPDADLKVFITASPEVRAERRVQQMAEQGIVEDYTEVLEAIRERDRRDSERVVAPLRKAPGSMEIDSGTRSVEDIVAQIAQMARAL